MHERISTVIIFFEVIVGTDQFPTYAAGSLIGSGDVEDQSAPKAFLNYVLFDNNYVMVDFGFDQVTSVGATSHDYLALHVNVKQLGYSYIYLSNENTKIQDVSFDDLRSCTTQRSNRVTITIPSVCRLILISEKTQRRTINCTTEWSCKMNWI